MMPSARNTTRSAAQAAVVSWVTITTVWPRSRTLISRNASTPAADPAGGGGGSAQAGQTLHQRGVAGAGRAQERGERRLAEADGDAVGRADRSRAGAVGLDQVRGLHGVAVGVRRGRVDRGGHG